MAGLAMTAFAGNSLLCRFALEQKGMDAVSFTLVRLLSGSLMLGLITGSRQPFTQVTIRNARSWIGALALFSYGISFSAAYAITPAASGALLLFGTVQIGLLGHGWWQGERLYPLQVAGLVVALAGLIGLLLPGVAAPPAKGAFLMVTAGVAWATYTTMGRSTTLPIEATCRNFLYAVPMGLLARILLPHPMRWNGEGTLASIVSGAVASALGYALWYRLLPQLAAIEAASLQLSVPVLTALGAVLWLGERLPLRSGIAGGVVLGGIALIHATPAVLHRQVDLIYTHSCRHGA
jgi:drug/metabolite transporter (DMT)-like permease